MHFAHFGIVERGRKIHEKKKEKRKEEKNVPFSFVCVLTWSLLGVKKSLGHAQIGLL